MLNACAFGNTNFVAEQATKSCCTPASASRCLTVREVLKPSEFSFVSKAAVVKPNPL